MNWPILCLLLSIPLAQAAVRSEADWAISPDSKVTYDIKWDVIEPFETLTGTYHLETMHLRDFPPILASMWSVNRDFNIVAWPPKYCQAVQICFIDGKHTAFNVLHIRKDHCTGNNLLKFYPSIGELHVNGKTLHNQMNTAVFRVKGNDLIVESLNKKHAKTEDFVKDGKRLEEKIAGAAGKRILLLTNSRHCYAHVSESSSEPTFQALLHPRRYTTIANLPRIFAAYEDPDGVRTMHKPIYFNPSTKSQDLIPGLKGAKIETNVQQSKVCNSFETKSLNPLKHSIGLVSVDSHQMLMSTDSDVNAQASFDILIKQCSWMRLWIDGTGKKFDTYDTDMKLDETIDLFFDQQFFVGADSNEARPLYGDSSQIGTISIKMFPIKPTPEKIVELSYGRKKGPTFPFKEYFYMPSMYESQVTVNIIKSPECSAVLVPGTLVHKFGTANTPEVNHLSFKGCEHYVLKADDRLKNDLTQRKDKISGDLRAV